MKRLVFYISVAIIFCILSVSCGGESQTNSVPLPKAWPRIDISVSDSMTDVPGLPVGISINTEAVYIIDEMDPPGLTVSYPSNHARIYYTFITPGSESNRQKVLRARQERINLNFNGAPADTYHSEDGNVVVLVARSGNQTPVQLLANLDSCIVSATAFIDDPRASLMYDSIQPLIDVLEHDLKNTIKGIQFK